MIILGAAIQDTFLKVPNGNGFIRSQFWRRLESAHRPGLKLTANLSFRKTARNSGNSFLGTVGPFFLGSEKFIARVRGRFLSKKVDSEVPQQNELAPALDLLIQAVSRSYGVERKDLFYSRRGHGNEARNVVIYLARRLRGDRLREIGEAFKIGRYSTVSSIVERMKVRIENDERLRKRVDYMISTIKMSQEQT